MDNENKTTDAAKKATDTFNCVNKNATQLTLMNLEKEVHEFKERIDKKRNVRYKDTKLSAETVTVIKKALQNFKTKELEPERIKALEVLSRTDDCFIVLYTRNKRVRVRKSKGGKK